MQVSLICTKIVSNYEKRSECARRYINIYSSELLDFCYLYKDSKNILFDETTIIILKPLLHKIKEEIDNTMFKYKNGGCYMEDEIKFLTDCYYVGILYFQESESSVVEITSEWRKIIVDSIRTRTS